MHKAIEEAKAAGEWNPPKEPCPWCGQLIVLDLDNWFADKKKHEKECPQIKEWERCKE